MWEIDNWWNETLICWMLQNLKTSKVKFFFFYFALGIGVSFLWNFWQRSNLRMTICLLFLPLGGNFEENFFLQKISSFFQVKFEQIFSEGNSRFFASVQSQSASPNWPKKFLERKKFWNFGAWSDFWRFPPIEKKLFSKIVRDQKNFHPLWTFEG